MRSLTIKKQEWNRAYRKLKKAVVPTQCARCSKEGRGWTSDGGDFEPHHVAGRATRAAMLLFVPACEECHRWIHENPDKAREEHWLIKFQTYDIFGNKNPR